MRLLLALIILFSGLVEAVPTKVIVRAKAKGAMFIGNPIGGALIVLRHRDTGKILAEGLAVGTTGPDKVVMADLIKRGTPLTDEGTAKFETTLDITDPTPVTIEVHAPYGQRQSMVTNHYQVWLIPGKDVIGDGFIVEVSGFAVHMLAPQPHEEIALKTDQLVIPIRASVPLMCGCPVIPGGIWDANKYDIKALVKLNGIPIDTLPMTYANNPSTFEANLTASKVGTYEVTVYGFDPLTGNAGVDTTTFLVSK